MNVNSPYGNWIFVARLSCPRLNKETVIIQKCKLCFSVTGVFNCGYLCSTSFTWGPF